VHGDTAACARALYWVWDRMYEHDTAAGRLCVHLLLNRAGPPSRDSRPGALPGSRL
jgi:hypothetical protein